MLIIEHNLEFITKVSDYMIDFGVNFGDKGGKVVEVQRKAHFLAIAHGENHPCGGLVEEPAFQPLRRGDHQIVHLFITCQLADEEENFVTLLPLCLTEIKFHFIQSGILCSAT